MSHPPTIKQLKYLCAVADKKHFSKAAQLCFVSQSTLSAGISELEQSLGVILIDRSKKHVSLTATGRDVTERARRILAEIDDLVGVAEAAHEPFSTEMRLGVIPTIAPFMLPKILKLVRKKYPKFKLFIKEDLSGKLIEELQAGELDVLLLALPYPADGVTTEHLFYDEFLLTCRAAHPLCKKSMLLTRDLKNTELLLLEDGHCLRDHVLEACSLKQADIRVPYQATSLNTVIQMVANNIGVTVLPKMAVDANMLEGSGLKAIKFGKHKVQRSIGLMWRKRSSREAEFNQFGKIISAGKAA